MCVAVHRPQRGYQQAQCDIYQDGGDNDCFILHSCCVICKDIRFGDGHFVNLVPVSDLWERTAEPST